MFQGVFSASRPARLAPEKFNQIHLLARSSQPITWNCSPRRRKEGEQVTCSWLFTFHAACSASQRAVCVCVRERLLVCASAKQRIPRCINLNWFLVMLANEKFRPNVEINELSKFSAVPKEEAATWWRVCFQAILGWPTYQLSETLNTQLSAALTLSNKQPYTA